MLVSEEIERMLIPDSSFHEASDTGCRDEAIVDDEGLEGLGE